MIRSFKGIKPQIAADCYIDTSAVIIGNVNIGNHSSIWPLCVVRGDVNSIHIGKNSNIQDGSVLHVSHQGPYNEKGAGLFIGDNVTVGHKAILHACTVHNNSLIGMGSIVMDDAIIESFVMLGAGSLVPAKKVLDSGYLWLGNPVKKIRALCQSEKEFLSYSAQHYVKLKDQTLKSIKQEIQ